MPTVYGAAAAAKVTSEATSTPETIQLAIGACMDKLLRYSEYFAHFKSLDFKEDGNFHIEMNSDRVPCSYCEKWLPSADALREHDKIHKLEAEHQEKMYKSRK
ncbi:hypothetical protein A1O7_08687 [Cladophialophora yegresii CBS 114405]|uniref:C2H2-type domain-containing protein n=1 Tax=Cladophialophora yegresii CBS 114405 TaxID=1182544 RepID=W9VJ96_9EURO|nr:uncharacterized protein A1O7_08687 [Cladophialophora yegresii CBS 114405]EXJ55757.1 hypothetical protein A1O7_08687 [Cladophialophora yegresii CBS 114405]